MRRSVFAPDEGASPSPTTTGEHQTRKAWKTTDVIALREALCIEDLKGKTIAEVAQALSKKFGRHVGARTVQRHLSAMRKNERYASRLPTFKAGRPPRPSTGSTTSASQSGDTQVLEGAVTQCEKASNRIDPAWLRHKVSRTLPMYGPPRMSIKVRPSIEDAQPASTPAVVAERVHDLRAAICCELMQLMGKSAAALHQFLDAWGGRPDWVGSRSTFLKRLAEFDPPKPGRRARSKVDRKENIAALRLHQITLRGPRGAVWSWLFAYDTRTHYIGASLFKARIVESNGERINDGKTRASLCQMSQYQEQLALPEAEIASFVDSVLTQQAVFPMPRIIINESLAEAEACCRELNQAGSLYKFLVSGHSYRPYLPLNAYKHTTLRAMQSAVAKMVNQYNRQVAEPNITRLHNAWVNERNHLRETLATPHPKRPHRRNPRNWFKWGKYRLTQSDIEFYSVRQAAKTRLDAMASVEIPFRTRTRYTYRQGCPVKHIDAVLLDCSVEP